MYLPTQITVTNKDIDKELLEGKKVISLGIQGSPDDTFTINSDGTNIKLGKTGIYELDLTNGLGLITNLKFSVIKSTVLVDILYLVDQEGANL